MSKHLPTLNWRIYQQFGHMFVDTLLPFGFGHLGRTCLRLRTVMFVCPISLVSEELLKACCRIYFSDKDNLDGLKSKHVTSPQHRNIVAFVIFGKWNLWSPNIFWVRIVLRSSREPLRRVVGCRGGSRYVEGEEEPLSHLATEPNTYNI